MFVVRLCILYLLLSVAGIWAAQAADGTTAPPAGYKMVLVAGDGSLPVFDNAVARFRVLMGAGNAHPDIQLLSASRAAVGRHGARSATLEHVLAAVASMRPAPGQGCLVFATSHGGEHEGLWLAANQVFLTPQALDAALVRGCGDAPTVVVVSSCFSGSFTQAPMTRANRVVLTAARADRTSFGCRAGRSYTVYDACLLNAFGGESTWKSLYSSTRACVSAEEQRDQAIPSEPQAWFGAEVADMRLR